MNAFRRFHCPQPAGLHRRAQQHLQVRLLEVGLALVDEPHGALVDVAADDLVATAGQHRRGGKPDVAQADNANLAHAPKYPSIAATMRAAAEPSP